MHGGVIGLLRGGETGFVDAVVQRVIDAGVHLFDAVVEGGGVVVIAVAGQLIKGAVEHADDLGALVAHDGLALFVPEDRHGDAAREIGIGTGIDVAGIGQAKEGIASGAGEVIIKGPAFAQHIGVYDRHADVILQPLQLAEDQRAMCPRAGIADIEVIAARFCLEPAVAAGAGAAVGGHPVAKLRCGALKLAA